MGSSIQCRLGYLVTPGPALFEAIGVPAHHEICRPVTVITPIRDYEDAFEGWGRAWITKAKGDFVAEFAKLWSEDFPQFTAQLVDSGCFDQWWSISRIDIMEIDSKWEPS